MIAKRMLLIQYNATPTGTKQPRYRERPTEKAIVPYWFSLLCSDCKTADLFCVKHCNQEEKAAINGTTKVIPLTW